MDYNKPNLSIVIPILNEAKNIKILIPKIFYHLQKNNIKKGEVLLIDDNSSDNINPVFLDLKKKFKFIYLLKRRTKKDLSKSCVMGFKKAKSNYILVMDGDLQHNPKYIPIMYQKLIKNDLDFVIGSRDLIKKGRKGLGIIRYISSIFLIFIINIALGKKTDDPMSGFFLFKKKFFHLNKNKLFNQGYKILADLLYANNNPLKTKDIQINFKTRNYGKSKMGFKILIKLILFIKTKLFKKLVR